MFIRNEGSYRTAEQMLRYAQHDMTGSSQRYFCAITNRPFAALRVTGGGMFTGIWCYLGEGAL